MRSKLGRSTALSGPLCDEFGGEKGDPRGGLDNARRRGILHRHLAGREAVFRVHFHAKNSPKIDEFFALFLDLLVRWLLYVKA